MDLVPLIQLKMSHAQLLWGMKHVSDFCLSTDLILCSSSKLPNISHPLKWYDVKDEAIGTLGPVKQDIVYSRAVAKVKNILSPEKKIYSIWSSLVSCVVFICNSLENKKIVIQW